MEVSLRCKEVDDLLPTSIVQQTAFWGRVKHRLGLAVQAFDLEGAGPAGGRALENGDFLVVRRSLPGGGEMAYVPLGPELDPGEEAGVFLERLSENLHALVGPRCLFVRWDLPWESSYGREADRYDASGHWQGAPEPWVRELRMNWGTAARNLWKAPFDMLPASTMVVDLSSSEDVLLARMKAKTRYNIRLAEQHGVDVTEGTLADLPEWYALYRETVERHGLPRAEPGLFEAVLNERGEDSRSPVRLRLLFARRECVALAGMILAQSETRATFLYGASARLGRECMASYALQWSAMRRAKADGCLEYDLFGVSPRPDQPHPMLGLHRFKVGFGGRLVHREGCWDFPFDSDAYQRWLTMELRSACRQEGQRS